MADLLFEIGTEELPWGAVEAGRTQMAANAASLLAAARLPYASLQVFSTPRRLAILVSGLADSQEAREEALRGPAAAAAFDEAGKPTQAAQGFARSKGVPVETLEIRATDKGDFVYAVVREEGREASKVLPALLSDLARSLTFKKSMRWGSGSLRFARPVRWLLALYGSEVLPVELDGLRAGNSTRGHRLSGNAPIALEQPADYSEALR
ncbi:MAG: glycine--tRNA ligase subunit beta, partial [Candidatus Geothermincolia bacterium]